MSWDALGAIAEIVGSIAVLLTLIYLARQIQQSNKSLEENRKYAAAQAYQARTDTAMKVIESVDPELLAELGSETLQGIDVERIRNLDSVSRVKLNKLAQQLMIATDNVIYQRNLGLMERVISDGDNLTANMLPIWKELGIPLRPAIQALIDERSKQDA